MQDFDLNFFQKLGFSVKRESIKGLINDLDILKIILTPNQTGRLTPLLILVVNQFYEPDLNQLKQFDNYKKETGIEHAFLINFDSDKVLFSGISRSPNFLRRLAETLLNESELRILYHLALETLINDTKSIFDSHFLKTQKSLNISEFNYHEIPFLKKVKWKNAIRFLTPAVHLALAGEEIRNFKQTKVKGSLSDIKNSDVFLGLKIEKMCQFTAASIPIKNKIDHLVNLSVKDQQYERAAHLRGMFSNTILDQFIRSWPDIKPIDLSNLETELKLL